MLHKTSRDSYMQYMELNCQQIEHRHSTLPAYQWRMPNLTVKISIGGDKQNLVLARSYKRQSSRCIRE